MEASFFASTGGSDQLVVGCEQLALLCLPGGTIRYGATGEYNDGKSLDPRVRVN